MKSINSLAALGRGAFFKQRYFIGISADQRIRRNPLKRRAFLDVFIDAMLIQRHRDGKLAGRHQLADQRVAFAKIDLLLGEPAPVLQAFFFARTFISAPNR